MQKKIAAMHDISGFGRCALTTAIPVLAACGLQCCPVPSAVLSAHTAFKGVTFRDLTDDIDGYIRNWADIGVKLDGVYSGYLGSARQANQVMALHRMCGKQEGCALIVDPVMGDNGKAYSIVGNPEFIAAMRELCARADVITPNLTECALLLGIEANGYTDSRESALDYMKRLADRGTKRIVVTGMVEGDQVGAGFYDAESGNSGFVFHKHIPVYYPGTGDLFTSVLTGRLLGHEGCTLEQAVTDAAHFVRDCAEYTSAQGTPPIEGVQFEKLLSHLTAQA